MSRWRCLPLTQTRSSRFDLSRYRHPVTGGRRGGGMSVLDDLRSDVEGVHGSFEEAKELVQQASDEASELVQSAAGHGWGGVAEVLSGAQTAPEEVAAA